MSKEVQKDEKQPKSVEEMLLEFKGKDFRDDSSLIRFKGVEEGKDVYNITAPFEDEEAYYIAGRVEARDSEHSQVIFFQQKGDEWEARKDIEPLELQDPFVTRIGGKLVLGGVEIFEDEENPKPELQNHIL